VEENVVHFYNVILGKIPCGAESKPEERNYSVFPEQVNCPKCMDSVPFKSRVQPEVPERSAA
jgi:hypothetical protein